MNVTRSITVSLDVLLGHQLRTLLSSSGIGIGVAAVVLMVGAGKAAEQDVVGKVQSMGTNLLVVRAGRFRTFGGHSHQVAHFTTLKPQDVRLIERHLTGVSAGILIGLAGNLLTCRLAGWPVGRLAGCLAMERHRLRLRHLRGHGSSLRPLPCPQGRAPRPRHSPPRRGVALMPTHTGAKNQGSSKASR